MMTHALFPMKDQKKNYPVSYKYRWGLGNIEIRDFVKIRFNLINYLNEVKKEKLLFSPYESPQVCVVPLNTRTLPDSRRMTRFRPEIAANLTVGSDC